MGEEKDKAVPSAQNLTALDEPACVNSRTNLTAFRCLPGNLCNSRSSIFSLSFFISFDFQFAEGSPVAESQSFKVNQFDVITTAGILKSGRENLITATTDVTLVSPERR